jgi:hypothetical protein
MGIALAARLHTGIAADAAAGVDEELHLLSDWHNASFFSRQPLAISRQPLAVSH